ncbi:MAG: hypothetical protein LBU87_02925 [Lactobacillales bacterium]|nr:hypothetical protein [Lactobacillales bacterium]
MIPKLYIARTADGVDFPLPSYTSKNHMALNLMAGNSAPVKINPLERVYIPVGFAIGIPKGYCGQIVSVPALAKDAGIIISDAPSLLHPADRKPVFVLIENISPYQYVLMRGTLVAQLLITPAIQVTWKDVTSAVSADQKKSEPVFLENAEGEDGKHAPEANPKRPIRSHRPHKNKDDDDEE